jgi:hypothetical protein
MRGIRLNGVNGVIGGRCDQAKFIESARATVDRERAGEARVGELRTGIDNRSGAG